MSGVAAWGFSTNYAPSQHTMHTACSGCTPSTQVKATTATAHARRKKLSGSRFTSYNILFCAVPGFVAPVCRPVSYLSNSLDRVRDISTVRESSAVHLKMASGRIIDTKSWSN